MQIYVPLNTKTSYDETKPFAHALARLLEDQHRELIVSDMKKAIRTNKIFVDWSQNDEHKTTVSVYSLRARERPTVSTPITWEEVERTLKKKDVGLLVFESHQTLDRVEKMGDLFAPLLTLKQKLPKLAGLGTGEAEAVATGFEMAAQARPKSPRKAPSSSARPKSRRKV
jgi:bifunctional non-homologous end joining protein LigD